MSAVYFLSVMILITSTAVSHEETVINVYPSDKTCSKRLATTSTTDPIVAFSVARKAGFSPGQTAIIPMDHVFYNDGGYFDMKTSRFTAPVSGLYALYFGACSAPGKRLQLQLYVGHQNSLAYIATTFNYNTGGYNQASGMVYKKMKKGEQAAVWSVGGHTTSSHDPPSTFFNGHLMQAVP